MAGCGTESTPLDTEGTFFVNKVFPEFGTPGTRVTINGEGFDVRNEWSVSVNGTDAEILNIEEREIVIRIPDGVPPGPADITLHRNPSSSNAERMVLFEVLDTPYPFTKVSLIISDLPAYQREEYRNSDGESDTLTLVQNVQMEQSVDIAMFIPSNIINLSIGDSRSNGDTVRFSLGYDQNEESSTNGFQNSSQSNAEVIVVIDSTRQVFSTVLFEKKWHYASYGTGKVVSEDGGERVVMQDIPYQKREDGALFARFQGSNLLSQPVSYRFSSLRQEDNGMEWVKEYTDISKLTGTATDDTYLEIVLERTDN